MFWDQNFGDDHKYFWKTLIFLDFENHSVCPNGRLGASRTPSPGTMACQDGGFERQGVMNSSIRLIKTETGGVERSGPIGY